VRVLRSRLLRYTLLAVSAVAVAGAILVGAAHLEFVRARVLDWAIVRASQDFGIGVEADSLQYNLVAASAELRNTGVSAPGDRPFFRADAIRIGLNRRALPGAFEIDRLEIDRPRLTIVRHADGTTNLPESRSDSTSAPSPIHLGRVALRTLSIELEDEAAGHRLMIAPIDLTVDTRAGASAPGAFGPTPISAVLGSTSRQVPPQSVSGTIAGRLGFDGTRLTVRELRLDVPEGRLTLDGWVDVLSEATGLEARATVETDLARASRFIPGRDLPLSGSVTADAAVSGVTTNPSVRVRVRAPAIGLGPVRSVSVAASVMYASERVDIESLSVASDAGAIDVNGTLAVTAAGESRLVGRIANLDIDRLLEAVGVSRPVEVGTTADGQLEVTLDGAVPLDTDAWRQANVNGSLALTPTGSGLSIGGRLDPAMRGGRWAVGHTLRSQAGRTSIDGTLSGNLSQLDDPATHSLSGSTRARIEEVRTLLPVLQRAGVSLPSPLDRADGIVELQIRPRGTVAAPALNATISGRGIRLPAIADAGELDSTVAVDRRSLTAESINVRIGQLRAAASGTYTWRGEIEGRFDANAGDLAALASALGLGDASVAGSADLKGSLHGTVQSPRAEGQLTARDVSAYGVPVGPVTAQLRLDQGRAQVDANAPDLEARLTGAVETRDPFGFQAEIDLERSPLSALLSAPQTKRLEAEGTIAATLRARGTMARLADTAGEIELRALDAILAGVPLALDTPAAVSFDPSTLSATPLLVRVGRETRVRLQGALSAKGALSGIDVQVESAISDLLGLGAAALPEQPIDAGTSRVKLDLRVAGTLAAPQPSGTLAVEAASLKYSDMPPFSEVTLEARIEPSRIALDRAAARWQGASISADGEIPLRMIVPGARPGATGLASWGSAWLDSLPVEPRSATLSARLTGVTTEALASFVDPAQLERVTLTADATLTGDADRFALDAIRASVVLDQASLSLAGVPLTQSTPTRVRLEGGRAHIDALRWNAEGNELRASGSADLFGPAPALDLAVDGALDLRVLGAFASGIASGGLAHTAFTVTGPLASPQIVGSIDVSSGELRLETPSLSASDFSGTIAVDAARQATMYLNGDINGGPAYVEGRLALDEITSPRGRVTVKAWNVMLEYPEGFQTESNADLSLVLGPASTLSGRVDVLSGLYREPLVVSQSLLAGFGGPTATAASAESSFLENLRLDVTIATANEIRIDNNYGRLNLTANLQATGSAANPGILGRIEAEPDGEVYLAGNTYRIQTLTIDLANPRVISPEVTFLAETRVGNAPIEISLQCGASGPCEREVRSQASGITNQEAEAMLFGISADPDQAGAQLARLLSGELLGLVSGSVGLDTLRLEQGGGSDLFDDPTLVAGDVNPASRLTVGKRLGDRVELAYSQDLSQNGFVMSTTYFAPAGISLRALLLDNEDRSYEFRHEPPIGVRRRPRPAAPPAATVTAVRFSGNLGVGEHELRGQLRLTDGDRFEFAAWQADGERLRRYYHDHGYFEARVRARRTLGEGATVTLEYAIEQGRPTRLEVSGYELPEDVRRHIIDRWTIAIFDRFLARDVDRVVRDYLFAQGRPQAAVTPTLATADGVRTLRVDIDPGPPAAARLQIDGNERVPAERVLAAAQRAGPAAAWLEPALVEEAVRRLYQAEGLLSADVDVSSPHFEDGESVVRVAIQEGGPWEVGRVTLGGVEQSSTPVDLGLVPGSPYDPRAVAERLAGLEQQFRNDGFLDVRVASETVLDPATRRADVHALVAPGPRTVLASVAVDGADGDTAKVARALSVSEGMPVGASALGAARRRLYETGIYRSVEIALEPAPDSGSARLQPDGAQTERPVVARIRVEERPRYSLRYGLAVSSELNAAEERETRLGFAADFENRNLLGRGLTVGLSARLRRDQDVARVFLGANRFFALPLRSTVFLSRSREDIGSDPLSQGVSNVTEISAEQMYRVRGLLDIRYGYGLGRNRTTGSLFDLSVRVARLTTSALVDRRNDPFDPAGGWFSSANFELSRPGLGSDISFLKSYLQLYQFAPLRGGVVLASAARVGLARTFRDEDLIPSEQFFAGGATSVRGYREDDLGPRSIFGDAEGGSALFVANSEVRFRIYRWIKGVGFVDLGDIYPTVSDLLASVQVSTGGGLRLDTPVGLIRFDLGVPVNPRPADPKWRFHFGLGHAF
jgi:outer membrane protein assembly factor BamA